MADTPPSGHDSPSPSLSADFPSQEFRLFSSDEDDVEDDFITEPRQPPHLAASTPEQAVRMLAARLGMEKVEQDHDAAEKVGAHLCRA